MQVAKKSTKTVRTLYFTLGIIAMITLWLVTDPDAAILTDLPVGGKLLMIFANLSIFALYALAFHWARKYIIDYVDFEDYITRAIETPQGAGLAAIAVSIYCLALALVLYAATSRGAGGI